MDYWSTGVLRPGRIAPRDREVGSAEGGETGSRLKWVVAQKNHHTANHKDGLFEQKARRLD